MINRKELIKMYIEFFKSKEHKEIPNSSLIPENDPTVLFTTAGMHPLVPFLLGEKHPLGKRLVGVQRCIRTGDIEEVGDEVHHTFFEMLGNWSLGDYWKKEAIEYSFEFLTKKLNMPKEKISVTCFEGEKNIPKDEETEKIWKSLGIKKVKFLPKKDNWWGPAGETGPCGPDTEMFINNVEIWNDVLMQYYKNEKGIYIPAKQKNIDTGMGVERTTAILNNLEDNYMTDCFLPIIKEIEKLSEKKYENNKKEFRIIADHIKASVFLISDGVVSSNTGQGYVLRRLIRRGVRYGQYLGIKDNFTYKLVNPIINIYSDYLELKNNKNGIIAELEKEENKFRLTLDSGIKEFEKITKGKKKISCKESFLLYQSYGFPVEMIEEECKARNMKFSRKEFEEECKIHQELSRTASAGKFKSGLADNSEATTKLHTASHLLLAAIRKIFKDNSIHQKGSNITPERLRFDFNFPRKLEENELKEIEKEVNSNIQKGYSIIREEMTLEEAKKRGATGVFENKYGEKVSVYTVGDCSKEICTGPHVKNTKELGKFRIIKEESSSNGVRRIKGVLE
jgi:alanyl-tRNA synthetase